MTDFVFVYHGPVTPMPEAERANSDAAWRVWIGKHAQSFPDVGQPAKPGVVVGADGDVRAPGPGPATGYTVVSAPDLEAATRIAAENPMVVAGQGSIEIAELIPFTT